MTTKTKRATKADCQKVLKALCAQLGVAADEYGPKLVMDWDWFGDGPRAAILWEGGPYDWPAYFPFGGASYDTGYKFRNVSDQIPAGVWVEAATSWAISIYKD